VRYREFVEDASGLTVDDGDGLVDRDADDSGTEPLAHVRDHRADALLGVAGCALDVRSREEFAGPLLEREFERPRLEGQSDRESRLDRVGGASPRPVGDLGVDEAVSADRDTPAPDGAGSSGASPRGAGHRHGSSSLPCPRG